ncbi:MAG TPA: 3'-5' exonuclease [Bacteroidales bacterium]|nr:3'-5' exonuclease [Bacteroidales bacterium]
MKLKLKNPLIIFDLETTGINIVTDRIVELSYLKVYPNGDEELRTMKINPTIPIPEKASKIHGITDQDVKDAPTFQEVARSIANIFEGCDFAGFNSNKFDIPLLAEEFIRADVDIDLMKRKFIDVQVIFHKKEQRTLEAAYKFYCNKNLDDAHSAEADTLATFEILKAQLERYEDLPTDIDELSRYSSHNRNADFAGRIIYDDDGNEVFNFGKYKGQLVEDVFRKDPAYYSWMMNSEFPLYTKKVLTSIKLRGAFKN